MCRSQDVCVLNPYIRAGTTNVLFNSKQRLKHWLKHNAIHKPLSLRTDCTLRQHSRLLACLRE